MLLAAAGRGCRTIGGLSRPNFLKRHIKYLPDHLLLPAEDNGVTSTAAQSPLLWEVTANPLRGLGLAGSAGLPGGPSLVCLVLPFGFLSAETTEDSSGVLKLQNRHFLPGSISTEKWGWEFSAAAPTARVPLPAPGGQSPAAGSAELGCPVQTVWAEVRGPRPLLLTWASGVPLDLPRFHRCGRGRDGLQQPAGQAWASRGHSLALACPPCQLRSASLPRGTGEALLPRTAQLPMHMWAVTVS